MGRFQHKSPVLSGDELGWRIAGLIDGEGCFHIAHHKPRFPGHRCIFLVGMRADDRAFLELIHRSTGLGRLYTTAPGGLTLAKRPGTKPQVHWRVEGLRNCQRLVALLDVYPPLSKKAQDYAIWRQAVEAWANSDWDTMAVLRADLMGSRAYHEEAA